MAPLLKPRGYPAAVSRHQVGNGDGGACGVTQPASSTVYAEVPDHLVDTAVLQLEGALARHGEPAQEPGGRCPSPPTPPTCCGGSACSRNPQVRSQAFGQRVGKGGGSGLGHCVRNIKWQLMSTTNVRLREVHVCGPGASSPKGQRAHGCRGQKKTRCQPKVVVHT